MDAQILIHKMKNLTTGQNMLAPNQTLEAVGYGDQSLFFELADKSGAGQMVSLQGKIRLKKKNLDFEATGRILSVAAVGATTRIELQLLQVDQSLWKKFLIVAKQCQGRADKIFNAIKES